MSFFEWKNHVLSHGQPENKVGIMMFASICKQVLVCGVYTDFDMPNVSCRGAGGCCWIWHLLALQWAQQVLAAVRKESLITPVRYLCIPALTNLSRWESCILKIYAVCTQVYQMAHNRTMIMYSSHNIPPWTTFKFDISHKSANTLSSWFSNSHPIADANKTCVPWLILITALEFCCCGEGGSPLDAQLQCTCGNACDRLWHWERNSEWKKKSERERKRERERGENKARARRRECCLCLICALIFTDIHTHTHTHTHTHARTHICTHTRTHTHSLSHTHTNTRTHTRTHTYTHIRTHTRTHTHTCTHIYTHIHTYTHTHMHTPEKPRCCARHFWSGFPQRSLYFWANWWEHSFTHTSIICEMTHSYVWHDSFTYTMTHSPVLWLFHTLHDSFTCTMTLLVIEIFHTFHDSFRCTVARSPIEILHTFQNTFRCTMTRSPIAIIHTYHQSYVK